MRFRTSFITSILLILFLSPFKSYAGIHQFNESFDDGQFCDLAATTAFWDSTTGQIGLRDFSMTMLSTVTDLGNTVDIKVRGDKAYLLSQSTLRIFDISDLENPSVLGSVAITSQAGDVEIAGHYAYVMSNGGGFIVIDISDPSSPYVETSLPLAGANNACLDGNHAYVTSWTLGLRVVDISDPTNPSIVGSFSGFTDGYNIQVSGEEAYACSYGGGVRVLDISDPTAPLQIGAYNVSTIRDIVVESDRAYIGVHENGVRILDISDPANPSLLGTFTSSYANGVDVNGNILYVSDWEQGVRVVDVSDPSAPVQLVSYSKNARDICVEGTTVFTSASTSLDIFKVADPILYSLETGSYDTPGSAQSVKVVGEYAYVADRTGGMHIIDVSDKTNPVISATMGTLGDCWDIDVFGDYAYVAAYEDGVRIVDISDAQNPQLVGTASTTRAVGVDVEGNFLYVADYWNGMVVIDISDPVNPTQAGLYTPPSGAAWSLAVDGDFAYVTFTHSTQDVTGFRVIDISDPSNPALHGSYNTPGDAQGVTLFGDYAFVADSGSGMLVLDISDPSSPAFVTTVAMTNTKGITVSGDYAFAADIGGGIRVLDISNPASPTILTTYDIADEARSSAFSGEHLFVSDYSDGLRIFHVFQREFETTNDVVTSSVIDAGDDEIAGIRLSSEQTGSIIWEVSADGGVNWQEVPGDNSWQQISDPGRDLLWRSTHRYTDPGINPVATALSIGWLTGSGVAQNITVDGVNDFHADNLIDIDTGDTEYPQIDLGSFYVTNDGDSLYIGFEYDRTEWSDKQVGIALSTGGPGGTTDGWYRAISWANAPHKPDYYAYCNINNEWQELRQWNEAASDWNVIYDGTRSLGWVNTSGFEELGLSFNDLGISAGDTIYLELISTQDSPTKGPLDLIAGDEDQLSTPGGTVWDVMEPVELDATVMYVVKEYEFGGLAHDDLAVNANDYFDWAENEIGWHASEDGYISEDTGANTWSAAIVSARSFDSADNPIVVFRFEHMNLSGYMFGFTDNPPAANNFHYSNIDHGIYVNDSGGLRCVWAISSTIGSLPGTGIYDVMIQLDQASGQVHFAIDDVAGYDSPISDFSSPVFTSSYTRTISGDYHIQTNPYTNTAKIYDVWSTLDPSYAPPQVVNVPGDAATIQEGINLADVGDTVKVAAGSYNEHDIQMKNGVILMAGGAPGSVTVDAQGQGSVLLCSGLSEATRISGLNITGGSAAQGGGIYINASWIIIEDCSIESNTASNNGGGIYAYNSTCVVEDCILSYNYGRYGGGLHAEGSTITFERCEVEGNTGETGAGLNIVPTGNATIRECLIVGNQAQNFGGAICNNSPNTNLYSCTLEGNGAGMNGGGIYNYGTGYIGIDHTIIAQSTAFGAYGGSTQIYSIDCSNFFGNTGGDWTTPIAGYSSINGNISLDPLFCGAGNPSQPHSLQENSPCSEDSSACGQIGALGVGCPAAPGSLAGTVTTDCSYGASGLEGVVISAYTVPGGVLSGSDTTGADGYYQITALDQGDYDLTVAPPSGFTADFSDTTVVVLSGQATTVDLSVDCPAMVSISSFSSDWNGQSGLLPDEACTEWQLYDTADPEDPVMSGDTLIISTSVNSHYLWYVQKETDILVPDTLVMEFRMRFMSGIHEPGTRIVPAVTFNVDPNRGNVLWIDQDEIYLWSGLDVKAESALVDTDDEYHWYRIEVYDKDKIRVFYDDELVFLGSTYTNTLEYQEIRWGDLTSLANGTSGWTAFRHNAGGCTAPALPDTIHFAESVNDSISQVEHRRLYELIVGPGDVGTNANFGFASDEALTLWIQRPSGSYIFRDSLAAREMLRDVVLDEEGAYLITVSEGITGGVGDFEVGVNFSPYYPVSKLWGQLTGILGASLSPYLIIEDITVAENDSLELETGVEYSVIENYRNLTNSGTIISHSGRFEVVDDLVVTQRLSSEFRSGTGRLHSFIVRSGGYMTHPVRWAVAVDIDADTLIVESGGVINVSNRGYRGAGQDGWSSSTAETYPGETGSTGCGGSHGGLGGKGAYSNSIGTIYGSVDDPVTMGAGGGSNGWGAGNGGGVVIIDVDHLEIWGQILANGERDGCGGAGGSINIRAQEIAGSGAVYANGGNYENDIDGGGGGGRIAVRYGGGSIEDLTITARGGVDNAQYTTDTGGAGTIYLLGPNDGADGTLLCDNGGVNGNLTYLTAGRSLYQRVRVSGEAEVQIGGAYLGEITVLDTIHIFNGGYFRCYSNTSLSAPLVLAENSGHFGLGTNMALVLPRIVIRDPGSWGYSNSALVFADAMDFQLSNGVWFANNKDGVFTIPRFEADNIAASRFINWGLLDVEADSIVVGTGSDLQENGRLGADDSIGSIRIYGTLSHGDRENTLAYDDGVDVGLDFSAGTIVIETGGKISADYRGYRGSNKDGWSSGTAETYPGVTGSSQCGGSHGGLGGRGAYSTAIGDIFGSEDEPVTMGGGGGSNGWGAGNGGGVVIINADRFEIWGQVSANGERDGCGGAGGSVNIRAQEIVGNGAIYANGGNGEGDLDGGGGGGRIAVRYGGGSIDDLTIAANGGTDTPSYSTDPGQPGTVRIIEEFIPPEIFMTCGPIDSGYVDETDVTFCWNATDNTTPPEQIQFSYSLDGGAYSAWSTDTTVTLNGLTEGDHAFALAAMDLDGHESDISVSFTVDITGPVTQVTAGPVDGGWLNTTDVTFQWSGSDNLTSGSGLLYSSRLDNESWTAYSSDVSRLLENLPDTITEGPCGNALRFSHADDYDYVKAGKWISGIHDNWTMEAWFFAETYAQDVIAKLLYHRAHWNGKTIAQMPDGTIRFSEEYATDVQIRYYTEPVELNAWHHVAYVSTPQELRYYLDGELLAVEPKVHGSSDWDSDYLETTIGGGTVDHAGDGFTGMIDEVRIWDVSRTDEQIRDNMTQPVDPASPGLVAYYRFDETSGQTVADSSPAGNDGTLGSSGSVDTHDPAWTDSGIWDSLVPHRFAVKARDLSGNIDPTPETTSFYIDIVPPETEIAGGPAEGETVGTSDVTVSWAGSDDQAQPTDLSFSYQLDGGGFSAAAQDTFHAFNALADGLHTVEVAAVDLALNSDQTPAARTFTVDSRGPEITLLAGPDEGTHTSQADQEFIWTAYDVVTDDDSLYFSYRLDTLDYAEWSRDTTVTFSGLEEGVHQFVVRSRDGNDHISSHTRNFTVDLTPPATALTAGPSEGDCWPQSTATFSWTGTDNFTGAQELQYSFAVDGDTFTAWSSAASHACTGLAQGPHSFTVRSRDLAGHIDPVMANVNFTVGFSDLVPLSFAVPDTVYWGQSFNSMLIFQNAGSCPVTVPWQDCAFVRSDSPVTSVQVGCTEHDLHLAPGETDTVFVPLVLPEDPLGCDGYWFTFLIDHGDQVFEEGAEDNNSINSDPVAILIPPHPDLRVASITAPYEAWSGQGNYVEWTVVNAGEAQASGGWKDYVYLSEDSLPGGDLKLSEFTYSYPLDSAAEYTHIHPVVFPEDLSGDRWIIVLTDAEDSVNEYEGEADNYGVSASFAISLTPSPNLVVSGIDVPANASTNDDVELSWVVENTGGAPTSTPVWYDRVFLSSDSLPGGTILGEFANPAYLPVGGQYSQLNKSVHIPKDISDGTYYLVVTTDARDNVDEDIDENDNSIVSGPIEITFVPYPRPDLAVTNIVAPTMGWSGNDITLSWTVENVGDAAASAGGHPVDWVILSTDSIAEPHERIHLGGDIIGQPLDPTESYTTTVDVPIPFDSSGQYYLFVWTDVDIYFDDPELGNNFSEIRPIFINIPPLADLAVTSVSASSDTVTAGTSLGVEWTVTNVGAGPGYVSNWSDAVYLSEDAVLDPSSDIRAHVFYHTGMIEPDLSYSPGVSAGIPSGITGEYYLFVSTDIYDHVDEGDFEGNNWMMRPNPVNVVPPPSADLQVTLVESSGIPMSGEQITITWTVENFGPNATTTSSWYDYVYMSLDSVFSVGSSTHVATVSHSGMLHLGESYESSRQVVLSEGLSGTYYFHVLADAGGSVYEADAEGNNDAAVAVPITLTPPPDLRVTYVQGGAEVTAGEKLPVQWLVRNHGAGVTKQTYWKDSFYLSADTLFGGDLYIAGFTHSGELEPDEFYQDNRDITIPSGYEGGYYVIARTDADGQVYEHSSEGNNDAWTSVLINSPPPDSVPVIPPPDLVLTQLAFIDGQADTMSFTVTNQSPNHPQTGESYWTDRFYLSDDDVLDTGSDILISSNSHVGGLPPGESYALSREIDLPDGTEGDFYLLGVTDQTARVRESDESNNAMSIPITVTLTVPDLSVASVTSGDTLYAGQPVQIAWSVSNGGTGPGGEDSWYDGVYLSKDQILDETDYNLGAKQHTGDLAVSASYNGTHETVIPNGLTGRHYFFVKTDKNNNVYEHDKEDNNIKYTVDGVEIFVLPPDYDLVVTNVVMPDTATVGEDLSITWTVANLGESNLAGQWLDAVYISPDTLWDIDDIHLGTAVRQLGLGAGQSYSQKLVVAAEDFYGLLNTGVPGVQPGDYYVLVMTDIYNQINEMDETNNGGYSASDISLDVTPMFLGVMAEAVLGMDKQQYYRLEYPPGQDLRFTVAMGHEFDEFELYISFGALPDRIDYDRRYRIDGSEEIIVSSPDTNVCYLMVYGDYIVGAGSCQILPEAIFFGLTDVSPPVAGNNGYVRFGLEGGQLDQVTDVRLRGTGGATLDAMGFTINRSTSISAEFDLTGSDVGFYDCIVYAGAADSSVDSSSVTIQYGTEPAVIPSFDGPDAIRQLASIDYVVWLHNISNTDARDVMHSIKVDAGSMYQVLVNIGSTEVLVSDGSPIYLYTNFIGVGESARYTVRLWGTDATALESETYEYDMVYALSETEGLVLSSWVEPVVEAYAEHVTGLGVPIDPVELRNAVVETWAEAASILRSGTMTMMLDSKIEMSLDAALAHMEGEPLLTGGISDSGETRPLDGSGTALESGVIASVTEAQDQIIIARSSGKFKKKRKDVTVRVARDPNEKFGPTSEGEENFVTQWQDLPYTIYFENIPTATAAAQNVVITDQLDTDLDWRKLRLGEINFGEVVIQVPENHSYYHTTIALDSGYLLEVDAGLNSTTGVVHWIFNTIDPATGLPPLDPNAGFLPPNDTTGVGAGHVLFTIKADEDALDGTEITNRALIVFDDNDPIETQEVLNVLQREYSDLEVIYASSSVDGREFSEGAEITVSASVFNSGDAPATNFEVAFYDGDPDAGGTLIETAELVASLQPGEERLLDVTWRPERITGESRIYIVADPWGTEEELLEDNNSRMLSILVEPRQYTVMLDEGINLISLPLEPVNQYTAQTLANDLGATMIIRCDSSGAFIPYIASTQSGEDFIIENTEGYIAVTGSSREVTYSGITHSSLVDFREGMNFVSLPLEPELPVEADSFCADIEAEMLIRYNRDTSAFETYIPGFHEGPGFPIAGASGYLARIGRTHSVHFTGDGWEGTRDYSPPLLLPEAEGKKTDRPGTAVLAVTGRLAKSYWGEKTDIGPEYTAKVRIPRLGAEWRVMTDFSTGDFYGAFVDYSSKSPVCAGDTLLFFLVTADGRKASEPCPYIVTEKDVGRKYVAYDVSIESMIPSVSRLYQNFPNPFNPSTRIRFQVAQTGHVRIRVYNVAGQLVKTLVDETKRPGHYEITWKGSNNNGRAVASGVYFCRMESPGYAKSMKVVVLR